MLIQQGCAAELRVFRLAKDAAAKVAYEPGLYLPEVGGMRVEHNC